MGDAAREPPDGFHLLGLSHLLFQLHLVRDIARCGDKTDDIPGVIPDGGYGGFGFVQGAVLPAIREMAGPGTALQQLFPHPVVVFTGLLAALQDARVLAEHFAGGVAAHPLERGIDVLDGAAGVRDDDRLRLLFDHHGQAAYFPQRALAFGDVFADAGDPHDAPVRFAHRRVVPGKRSMLARLGHDVVLVMRGKSALGTELAEEGAKFLALRLRNHAVEPIRADQFLARPARDVQQVVVAEGDLPFDVERDGDQGHV